ncbi:uncharacterized protein LOC132728787 isoform X1 [Ruditapes philippinarum]|uniref:uncharacterized protein LOC132728787 isoform X1 n=2 Tax=Ruditapes philippinarum TaxID=129788 RepID=UPI00295B9EDA|nr:uncharacterized protein LOC132728787 isoform X1 [Ruditapes philippinarum]
MDNNGIKSQNLKMASVLNTDKVEVNDEEKLNLEHFLIKKQQPDPTRDKIIQNSKEKYSQSRQNSADASNLSRSQKERKLDDFLKNKRRRRRGKKRLTISDVRAEAAKILEEFLQEQLAQQAIQTSSPEYQRIVELSVFETTTPSGESSSCLASSCNILREDSIPYADESDNELRKAESLPHENFVELQGFGGKEVPAGLKIHHEKSKSAPYSEPDNEWRQSPSTRLPGTVQPTPSAPPGTPHTPSENSSNGSGSLSHPVPYTGKPNDSSIPCSSDSLDTNNSLGKPHSRPKRSIPEVAPHTLNLSGLSEPQSRSTTSVNDDDDDKTSSTSPTKYTYTKSPHRVKKSGSVSSSDTDSTDQQMHGRKKKSMFKKAQHRMQNFFRNKKQKAHDGDDEMDNHNDESPRGSLNEKTTRPKKYSKKHDKGNYDTADMVDMADNYVPQGNETVLEERHIHRNKHIHQTHSGSDRKTVLRSEVSEETIDVVDKKEKKHTEKKWKMKESSGQDTGLFGKLKRLTLRDKRKRSMKESKSDNFGQDAADSGYYSRTLSVPGSARPFRPNQLGLDETDDAGLTMYPNGRGFAFSNFEREERRPGVTYTRASQDQTSDLVICREEGDEKDIKRHSSHLDIVDYSGNMIERLYFDADGNELPKNKSFSYLQEEDVRERVIDDHGRRRVVRDVKHHEHMEMAESDGEDKKDLEDMTEAEKDELYGKIASRLATIGDNLMSEREDQSRSASASPRSKLTDDQKSSPEQEEFTKTTLTPLEIELRDELRKVADDMDAMLEANAKKAALHISGIVTYNHFKNIVQESVGKEQGWAQVAAVFQITKRAMRLAGQSGAMALQIKEMSLKYIEDTFANWIVGQGGWESMLSDADSDTESELD